MLLADVQLVCSRNQIHLPTIALNRNLHCLRGLLQAPIMAAEAILVKWAKNRQLLLPRPVAIFLTNFLLIVVANPLFFGPCDWSGMCSAMFDNVQRYFV